MTIAACILYCIFIINLDHFIDIYFPFDIKGTFLLICVKKPHLLNLNLLWCTCANIKHKKFWGGGIFLIGTVWDISCLSGCVSWGNVQTPTAAFVKITYIWLVNAIVSFLGTCSYSEFTVIHVSCRSMLSLSCVFNLIMFFSPWIWFSTVIYDICIKKRCTRCFLFP